MENKLWSGRFEKKTDESMNSFHSSFSFDSILYRQDITGSIAHATMLGKQNIIPQKDVDKIVEGLKEILEEISQNKIDIEALGSNAEDIHMFIETLLTQKIGDAGKKVHTGRSRNDQVALDMRLYMLEANEKIKGALNELCKTLVLRAKQNINTIMPGYTHMQKAQPITLAHHIMAYYEMFSRDVSRIEDCKKRTDFCPLGAGALATSTYNIDREFVAKQLGFSNVCQNSLDAVSDRDFCIEFACCASLIMMHLSRFCEELIIWSTDEFKFVEMDDAYSTGSSIMPQKKNPDVAELIRGKTGRVYGDLMALLSTMKSLPLAYNKDMQEDKEATFDAVNTTVACLEMFSKMFSTLSFKAQNMANGANKGFTNATDAADYLVKKNVPFRDAHEIIGKIVLFCIKNNKAIDQLDIQTLKRFSNVFDEDVYKAISLETCVMDRNVIGGPAPSALVKHIEKAQALFKD